MNNEKYNGIIFDALEELKKGRVKECENKLMTFLLVCPNIDVALNLIGICRYYYCDFTAAKSAWKVSYVKYNSSTAKIYLDYMESKEGRFIEELYDDAIKSLEAKKYLQAKKKLTALLQEESNLIVPKRILSIIKYKRSIIKGIPEEIEDPSNIAMISNNYKYICSLTKRYLQIVIILFLGVCYLLGYLLAYL